MTKDKQALAAILLFMSAFLILVSSRPCPAGPSHINDHGRPSFAGYTGLWDMPDAKLTPDWHLRIGGSYNHPYYYVHITTGLFDRLEINGRVTGIRGEKTNLGDDYGDYKDKSIDLKFIVLKESDFWPSIAVGANDIHGTGLFTSRYLVGTKTLGPWRLTLGLGQGMLGGKSSSERAAVARKSSDDAAFAYLTSNDTDFKIFGGVEYMISEKLSLLAEYSSIEYEKVRGGEEAKIPINLGLKYYLGEGFHIHAGYARGETLSAGLFFDWPLDPEGPLGWEREAPPVREERDILAAATADEQKLAEVIASSLKKDGFSTARVLVSGNQVWVEIANTRYNSPAMAVERAFRVLDMIAPNDIDQFYLVLTSNGVFLTGLGASREHMRLFWDNSTDKRTFLSFSEITTSRERLWKDFAQSDQDINEATTEWSKWNFSFRPRISTFLNDPSGFFKARISMDLVGQYLPWKGGQFIGRYSIPIYNDISTSQTVDEPNAASTDIIQYTSRQTPHFTQYGFDQMLELPAGTLFHIGAGAFTSAYLGFGSEIYKSFWGGRLGIGLEGFYVWKRDLENDFQLREGYDPYYTYHLNIYTQPFANSGLEFGFRIGRFLAGDQGVRFEVARTFRHFTLGGWYTITDTSDFNSEFNRDYRDKGVFVRIPLSIFDTGPTSGRIKYSLAPWTRDPGQMIGGFRSLYPMGDEPITPYAVKSGLPGND
jgi:hypothetical protein